MPMACRSRSLVPRCERAAWMLRCWVRWAAAAIRSADAREQRRPGIQSGTSVFTASRTWHTVRAGAFGPPALAELGEERVAHAREDQVPLDRHVPAGLEVVHPQFAFAVLEQPLDPPAAEGHEQQVLDARALGGVAKEEIDLGLHQHTLHDPQAARPGRQAPFV